MMQPFNVTDIARTLNGLSRARKKAVSVYLTEGNINWLISYTAVFSSNKSRYLDLLVTMAREKIESASLDGLDHMGIDHG